MTNALPCSSQSYCLVIPVFRHFEPLRGVLAALAPLGLPCVLVDDGNPVPLEEALNDVISRHPWVHVIRSSSNQGKGAAVRTGIFWAAKKGHSHALTLDADGQHDPRDIPRALALSKAHPESLLLAKPVFSEDAPWGRRWGRLLTSFWTWIETLSFDIGDSLFGFRCYPIAPVRQLLTQEPCGNRMDFDPEIVVRLHWAGVPVVNFNTNVQYPPGGVSNFRLVKDNGTLILLHTRLCFGMLRRWFSGQIHFGGQRPASEQGWRHVRERGARVGMLFTAWAYRWGGRGLAEIILWFVVTYFFVTSRSAREASRHYWARVTLSQGNAKKPSLKTVHGHFMDFAKTSLDRFDVWTGGTHRYRYEFKGREHLDRLVSGQRGALLFGAHMGNSDVLRALLDPSKATVHFLTDQRGSQKFFSVLRRFAPRVADGASAYNADRPENILELKAAVDRGEFVGLLADRIVSESGRGARRVLRVPFFNQEASFPQAPFLFASKVGCPVLFISGMRRRRWEYELIVEPLFDRIELPDEPGRERDDRLRYYLRQYAQKLESLCVTYPTQWFNFYDFWRA
jgi:predicted LPLAT superfamily acyltransferase